MDDYLDTFGDHTFGKRIGGDILMNKKTFLLINALNHANADQTARIEQLFVEKDEEAKISGFQAIFKEIGVGKIALDEMDVLHQKSVDAINASSISQEDKNKMIELGEIMLRRTT